MRRGFKQTTGRCPGNFRCTSKWCGRDYARFGAAQTSLVEGAALGQRVATVPHLWSDWPAYATVDRLSRGTNRPCSQVLYLETSAGRYVHYLLQGGP